MDAVTAVSGSGPAYVFLLIEALAEAGARVGLPADLALRLARATVAGAGELARLSPETPARLRENVTSPGGTTRAALDVLMAEDGLPAPARTRGCRGHGAVARTGELSGSRRWQKAARRASRVVRAAPPQAERPGPDHRCRAEPHRAARLAAPVDGGDRRRSRFADPHPLPRLPVEAGDPVRVFRGGSTRRSWRRRSTAEADERPRDRVFDLLMRRFDALRPYRDALEVLGRELPTDPLAALGAGARVAALDGLDARSGRDFHRRVAAASWR